MAAPHVAGVAALVLAQQPSLLPSQVLAKLQGNALPALPPNVRSPVARPVERCAPGTPPPPPSPVAVSLKLDSNDLQTGESTTARATVTQNGAPIAGQSGNLQHRECKCRQHFAWYSPHRCQRASAVRGKRAIQGRDHGKRRANGATPVRPVRVPDLALPAAILVIGLAVIIVMKRNRKAASKSEMLKTHPLSWLGASPQFVLS